MDSPECSTFYVTSAEGGTGKSTVALGLLEALKSRHARVGVFRPISRSTGAGDYVLEMLLDHSTAGLDSETCTGATYADIHARPDDTIAVILERFSEVSSRCDAVVVIGSDYTDVATPAELAVNSRIAAALAAPVVLVLAGRASGTENPRTPAEIAEVAGVASHELAAQFASVAAIVVTRAVADQVQQTRDTVSSATGIATWAIPEDPEFMAPLLGAVLVGARATLQSGDARLLDEPVLGTVVAGMSLEHVLDRLIEGAVVVIPADRPGVLIGTLAAHLSDTFPSLAGIVLNGPFALADSIRRVIDGLGTDLPIAATDLGTFDSATRIHSVRSLLAADSPAKYRRALDMFDANVDAGEIMVRAQSLPPAAMTPERFEHSIWERARAKPATIVLAEGDDDRVLRAAAIVSSRKIAELIILGDRPAILARATELGIDLSGIRIVSPHDRELVGRFADEYAALRAHKGVTREQADTVVQDVSYFATMMVHLGLAGGMVSGARHSTAHTIRPAFEIVKTAPGFSLVSSVFFMSLADRVLVYGDCAIVPEPGSAELADIAIASATTARTFGIEPRIAMLSYSTGESGSGADVDAVRVATQLVRERRPDLPVAGPIQYDAAIDPTVGASKMPESDVAGHATVFVFPDLNTGNNTYKAVQRSANALAIGPILQGLAKPVNDLSRGALVRDIVNTIAITAVQATGGVA